MLGKEWFLQLGLMKFSENERGLCCVVWCDGQAHYANKANEVIRKRLKMLPTGGGGENE